MAKTVNICCGVSINRNTIPTSPTRFVQSLVPAKQELQARASLPYYRHRAALFHSTSAVFGMAQQKRHILAGCSSSSAMEASVAPSA